MEKKILLVDDKPENLIALEKLLEIFDVTLIKAYSGNEALTLTLEHDFAMALIDVQMPDMDGYETVKLMRNVDRTRLLPVIFLSAIYSENHYLIQGIEAGAVDFITKPIQPRILLGKVKIFLDLFQQRKELEHEIENRKKTESSLLETQVLLEKARDKAEESDRLKSAFLSNMSHEIRTPLNAIVGFSNLLVTGNFDLEKQKQFIKYINNSSEALTTLINDILDIAKIEAGFLTINKSVVNFTNLLKELFITFKAELGNRNKDNVVLKLKMPDEKAVLFANTDETRLKQVFSNLINNAFKFCKKGEISFGIKEISNKNIVLFVSDTGIGIENSKLGLIFERFLQVQDDRIENPSGTGLGLSIVKKIIELLDGTITVTSDVNKGSTFFINLQNFICDENKLNIESDFESDISKLNITNANILIAEDEITNFYLLQELLIPSNAIIKWVKNGVEAIDVFKKGEKFDLVLMDIKMPEKNGYEAFEAIRKIDPNVPIVAQTAYAMSGEKDNIIQYGFDDYLSKPINETELANVIRKFLK